MKKARWAFFNAGGIVRSVAAEAVKAKNAEVVAVCSRSIEKARAFADEFGIADAYGNHEQMLSRDDIDIVFIGLPNNLHAEYSTKCLEAGKGVVCEKPMARSAAETKRMIKVAEKNDAFLMEGYWSRFFPAVKKALEWIKGGRIGRPLYMNATFGVTMPSLEEHPEFKRAMEWRTDAELGGGGVRDLGIYCVALSCDVMGGAPDEINAFAKILDEKNGADIHNAIIFRHGQDGFSHLSTSYTCRMPTHALIYGEKGSIVLGKKFWQPERAELFINKGDYFTDEPEETFVDEYLDGKYPGYIYEIEAASQAVLEGRKQVSEVSWDYSVRLAEVLDAVADKWGIKPGQ
jgi:predicted dehydrogenase